jgi:hypothetical protein
MVRRGVSGSSPEEGLKSLQIGTFCCLVRRDLGEQYGGGHVHSHLQELSSQRGPLAGGEGTLREHPTYGPLQRASARERVQALVDDLDRVLEQFVLRGQRPEGLDRLKRLVDQGELVERKPDLSLAVLRRNRV